MLLFVPVCVCVCVSWRVRSDLTPECQRCILSHVHSSNCTHSVLETISRCRIRFCHRTCVSVCVRGVYRFSSLVKQNKKAKICFVIHIAGERKLLFYIYAVIVKQIFYKRAANHYLRVCVCVINMYAHAHSVCARACEPVCMCVYVCEGGDRLRDLSGSKQTPRQSLQ